MKEPSHVARNVRLATVLGRQEVAGPSVMPTFPEGATDYPGELAGDQDSHL
jgi:hypothetical protein